MADLHNETNNTVLSGTAEDDSIYNEGSNVTINLLGGDDTVNNKGANVSISGGDGNDDIDNSNSYVSIEAGNGDDTVNNSGKFSRINLGNGKDSIYNSSSYVSIDSGADNDTVRNYGDTVTIGTGTGNDIIYNNASEVTISSGEGIDSIDNHGEKVSINAGAGVDTIRNYANLVTIDAGAGNDEISNSGSNVLFQYTGGSDYIEGFNSTSTLQVLSGSIKGGSFIGNDLVLTIGEDTVTLKALNNNRINVMDAAGNVTDFSVPLKIDGTAQGENISNEIFEATINALGGDDTIENNAANVSISGGANNDSITNYNGDRVTIDGGAGNDTINTWGENTNVSVNGGTGDDFIHNNAFNSTLDAGDGNDSIGNWGENANNVSINGGAGNDSIDNNSSKVTIDGGAGLDTITNGGDNVTINGGDGNDSILNYDSASSVSIDGGNGDDYISNSGYNVTINAGDGANTVNNNASSVSIISGAGNDSISNSASYVKINSGAGNDSISNSGSYVLFQYTGGNDVIEGFNSTSTLQVMSGNIKSTSFRGNDLLLTIDQNTLTLKDIGNIDHIEVMDSVGSTQTFKVTPLTTITGTAQAESIKNAVADVTINALAGDDTVNNNGANSSINGGAGNDSIVNLYSGKYSTINGDTGKDSIYNSGDYASINAGAGDDNISNSGDTVTIDAGADNDYIYNGGHYVSINAGAGDDEIYNDGYRVTINAGTGNDVIRNYGDNVLFKYTGGNDIIQGFNSSSTLQIMSGSIKSGSLNADDIVLTIGENTVTLEGMARTNRINIINASGSKEIFSVPVTITGTADSENISNEIYSATIDALGGDDTIENYAAKVSINAGAGDDSIKNWGDSVTIDGSAGNDSIYNNSSNVSIGGGTGDDSIDNEGYNSTIDAGDGADTVRNFGYWDDDYNWHSTDKTSISGGAGNDSIASNGSEVTIDGGLGDDSIYNDGDNVLFKYTGGNDIIEGFRADSTLQIMSRSIKSGVWSDNDAILTIGENTVTFKGIANVTNRINIINAAGETDAFVIPVSTTGTADMDIINNYKSFGAIIDALGGNDKITNSCENVSISGGDGRDNITNTGKNSTILGGADNDTINNNNGGYYDRGSSAIIDGGAGNDSIANSSSNSVSIAGGVGKDNITNNEGNNVTISGGAGDDAIKNDGGNSVLIDAGADNDQIINLRGKNTSVLGGAGNDVIFNNANDAIINGGEGNDIITNQRGNNEDEYGDNVTFQYVGGNDIIFGFNETSILEIGNGNDTFSLAKNGNDVIVTTGKGNITLDGAATLNKLNIVGEEVELSPSWRLNETMATYGTKDGTLVTLIGVKSTNGIIVSDDKTVTVPLSALNNSEVIIKGDGYKLALASDVEAPKTTEAHFSGTTYKSESNTEGYSIDNNKIIYTAAKEETDLFTIYGVKSTKGIKVDGTTVTVSKAALGIEDITVNNEDYQLSLAKGVTFANSIPAHFVDGAIYKSVRSTEGYTLADNKISYTEETKSTDLFKISGVKNTDEIMVNGTEVIVPLSALGTSDVIVSDGYVLGLASNVKPAEKTAAHFDGTVYKSEGSTEGYSLDNNKIIYTAATESKDLFKISGVKNTDGITVEGKIVTIPKASLSKTNVKISNGYKLALDIDVESETTKAWTLKGSSAIYAQTKEENYTLSKDAKSIKYSKEVVENLIKITGVKSASGLKVSEKDKTVTVSKAALGTKKVKINSSSGYKLKLDVAVSKPEKLKANWSYKDNTATYKSASKVAGYTLSKSGKSITYSKAKAASTLATVTGLKSSVKPTVKGKVITLTKSNLSSKEVTISSEDYKFNLAEDDYKKTLVNGGDNNDDFITSNGSNLSIAGNSGDDTIKVLGNSTTVTGGVGNDSIMSSKKGGNVFVYGDNDGNDVITNFANSDQISIKSGTADVKLDGNNVVFTIGKSKITVKGGISKKITYIDSTGKHTYPKNGVSLNGAAVTISEEYSEEEFNATDYGNSIQTIDATAASRDLEITANDKANTIIGGNGNDTLIGGKGNDSLKGGKGSDIFVYATGDGNDVITDYKAEDKIKITSGTAKVTKNGKDVIFTVGKGKITVKGAAEKVVTYINANGKTNYYPAPTKDSIIINGTTVKLLEQYKSDTFDVSNVKNGNKVEMIDASEVSSNLKIVGNAQANLVLGGKGNDTLYGGKGNDTLQGDNGKNVFVYANGDGNDVIIDYNTGDKINLTSGTMGESSVKDNDFVFKVGKGKITLTNGAGKVITVVSKKGNTIIGNDKANTLKGSDGADTLQGGKGDDSLWGGKGNDTFIYASGDGNDKIFDYASGDLLQIVGGSFSKSSYKEGTLTLTVGKGSITMENISTSTDFNINGKTYHISGKKLVK